MSVQQQVGWSGQFVFSPWQQSVGLNRQVVEGAEQFEVYSVQQRVG